MADLGAGLLLRLLDPLQDLQVLVLDALQLQLARLLVQAARPACKQSFQGLA